MPTKTRPDPFLLYSYSHRILNVSVGQVTVTGTTEDIVAVQDGDEGEDEDGGIGGWWWWWV